MSTTVDRRSYVIGVLSQLGNWSPSANTINFVLAWGAHESGNGALGCNYNLLNVAGQNQGEPNACGACNSIPVNHYCSLADGIRATALRLQSGLYSSIAHALATNDENNLGFNGHPIANNVAGDLSVWVSGRRSPIAWSYVDAILLIAGQPISGQSASSKGSVGQTVTNTLSAVKDQLAPLQLMTTGAPLNVVLSGIDNLMYLNNPFDVSTPSALDTNQQEETAVIGWLVHVADNTALDIVAIILRLLALLAGVYIILKVFNVSISLSSIQQTVTSLGALGV
jgi:hypothetical protein